MSRAAHKMVLTLKCGHTLHLWPRTDAEHNFNRATSKPGRSALCAECERLVPIVSGREEQARP